MIQIEKYHGTGNDFVIVDADVGIPDRRAFARRLCDRDTGIEHADAMQRGADGVLFLALEPEFTPRGPLRGTARAVAAHRRDAPVRLDERHHGPERRELRFQREE